MTRARILKQAHPAPAALLQGLPWREEWHEKHRAAPRTQTDARTVGRVSAKAWASLTHSASSALTRLLARRTAPQTPEMITLPGPDGLVRKERPAMGLRKRMAVLIAVITVPAMAAPGEFAMFAAPEPAPVAVDPLALAAAKALPFERPGMSFPGSAFFFLDDPPADALIALPTADPLDTGAEAGRELGEVISTGPAAKPFFSAGTGVSHARALECLAQAVWYEAATESEAGQRAVAQVVLNRVAHPAWPASVCGVVYQGSDRVTGCQFTFTCDGSLARRAGGASWARAQAIAAEALAGKVYAPVGHATHYHTLWVNPYWASTLDHVGTIGAHRFYRNRGAGGEKAAFTMAYAGFEPSVSGRTAPPVDAFTAATRDFIAGTGASDRLDPAIGSNAAGLARARSGGNGANRRSGRSTATPPDSSNPAFVNAGEVLPEFADVGRWKADPQAELAGNSGRRAQAASTN